MRYWQDYVRAGWEVVMEAQGRSQTYLEPDLETFLVHSIARNMENTRIWDEPVSIRMLTAQQLPREQRQPLLGTVGEECLFIDAWQIQQPRWPSPQYFQDMGEIAFGMASTSSRPPDELLGLVSSQFALISQVLRQARNLSR